MKKIILFILVCLVSTDLIIAQHSNTVGEELQDILNQKNDELIDINIFLKSKMPAEDLKSLNVKSNSRDVRREIVVKELKKFSEQSQESVMSILDAETRSSNVVDIKAHWLVNYISCKASRDVIYLLASHPDIKYIDHNSEMELSLEGEQGFRVSGVQSVRGSVSQNISHVQADKVWDLGYTGKGIIVAVIDSGINTEHIDLKDHLWYDDGAAYPGHNFVFPSEPPTDDQGHGTHCSGTVCGDGTSGLTTGMAPDATLMPLKVTNRSTGVGAGLDRMVSAVEYAVENGANIISISIGFWAPSASIKESFRELFTNTLQAGVVVAQAAGNNRESLGTYPAPNNINTPGDCPPPWFHPDQTTQVTGTNTSVICVGAVDENNVIVGISSQGPVSWTNTQYGDYPYNPGMGLIRPDIVAPGASVQSLDFENNSGYAIKAGTSMAAPCVAGVMALMLEKNPDLTPSDLCRIIETTATKITDTKSNDYGSGVINALAAVQAVDFNVNAPVLNKYAFTKNLNYGQNQLELTLVNNGTVATSGTTNVSLSTNDNYITINNTTATYNAMAPNATATNNFTLTIDNMVPDNHIATLTVTATNGNNSWTIELEVEISNPFYAPTNITTQVQNLTSVAIAWDATNNATSYNIYRDDTFIANTTSTSYLDEGLNYGTLYAYTITSKRGELESEHSFITRVQTDDNPDKPSPTNVIANLNNNNVDVTWTNGANSKSSNIYRKDSRSDAETQLASNLNGTSYTDNNWNSLTDGIYQYGVANNYAVNEIIYEENFANLSLTTSTSIYPTMNMYWYYYMENSNNTYNWTIAESINSGPVNNEITFNSFSGNAAFIKSIFNNSSYLTYLVSRPMDYTQYDGNEAKLSFYYITPAWGTDVNTLKVMISTTSYNSGWTELWSSDTNVSDWTKNEIDLSAYLGSSFYLAFVNVAGFGYCTGVDEISISVEGNTESRIEWSEAVHKGMNMFVVDGLWSDTDNWSAKQLPTENDSEVYIDANVTIAAGDVTVNNLIINEGKSLTLNSGSSLTVNNDFKNTDPDAFIINDGAQVFQNNDDVAASFKMNIYNPQSWGADGSDHNGGWQFIASPVKNASINDFIPLNSDYDLYKYVGTNMLEWVNQKNENNYEGSGDEPDEPVDPIVPSTPAAPVVTAVTAGSSSILLTWDAVEGATSYKIYSVGTEIAEVTGTSYTVGYLASGTEYCFSVTAVNDLGESAPTEACAKTNTSVTIGGNSTEYTSYIPVYFSYGPQKFSYSQQIYLASEMQDKTGLITQISFEKCRGVSNHIRSIAVYIQNTTKDSFSTSYDWIPVENAPAFEGDVAFGYADGLVTIELDTPFQYTAGNNIVISIIDKTGTGVYEFSNFDRFYTYESSNRALYTTTKLDPTTGFVDGANYQAQGNLTKNNKLRIIFGDESKSATRNESCAALLDETHRGSFETTFEQGRGYMASYESETIATFKGILNHESEFSYTASYHDKFTANFFLYGNPFSFDMDWDNVSVSNMIDGYAMVNPDGSYSYYVDGKIKVGDGFFARSISDNPTISYSESRSKKDNNYINVIVKGQDGNDNVIINLNDKTDGFPKMKNFNKNIANIYVSHNDINYGIYNYSSDTKEIDLHFQANQIGRYTIGIESKEIFEYVKLVDLLTETETDLLHGSYCFTASNQDDTKRFLLKLSFKNDNTEEHFVYQSGKELIINTKGNLQIIDIMGRIVFNGNVDNNDRVDVSHLKESAYIIRCIDSDKLKTQKIVIL